MDAFKFTPEEHRQAAMGLRALATISEADAKNQSNPTIAEQFSTQAIGLRQLAAKYDRAGGR